MLYVYHAASEFKKIVKQIKIYNQLAVLLISMACNVRFKLSCIHRVFRLSSYHNSYFGVHTKKVHKQDLKNIKKCKQM